MISPKEWGQSGNHLRFIAKVRLLGDKTWKVISESGESLTDTF